MYRGWRIQENTEVGVKIRREERSKEKGKWEITIHTSLLSRNYFEPKNFFFLK